MRGERDGESLLRKTIKVDCLGMRLQESLPPPLPRKRGVGVMTPAEEWKYGGKKKSD